MTSIEWTRGDDGTEGVSWNPVRGCRRVSEGCRNCYAEGVAARFSRHGQPYEGLAGFVTLAGGTRDARWSGAGRFVPERLADPLHWRKPRRVFVNSMSDLFFEAFTFEQIAAVFGVMAACPQHTFQVLTKRPARAREFFAWVDGGACSAATPHRAVALHARNLMRWWRPAPELPDAATWPLSNVHLGASVEDQETYDERVPLLLRCPAALHWISYEPALGPIDLCLSFYTKDGPHPEWVVVGGESGAHARPFDLSWARSVIAQGRAAGVPVFVKQLGARPNLTGPQFSKKGGDPGEWPPDLRVREFPREEAP